MSESTSLLLGIVAGGGLCALWAWLQLLNTASSGGDVVDDDDAAPRCGLDGCDVCRGVCRSDCLPE